MSSDATLQRRAAIIESLYRDGIQRIPELATSCDAPREEIASDVASLVEQGAVVLTHDGEAYYLSDSALAAMDLGIKTAAQCVVCPGAMPITNLAAENERLKDLVRHVQSQPDGPVTCRVELLSPRAGNGTMVITMSAGDEQAMAARIGEWLTGHGVYHGETGKRLKNAERWAEALGAIAWTLKGTLETVARLLDSCDDIEAEGVCKRVLGNLRSMPEITDCMEAMYAKHKRRALPPDWPHVTLADCAVWAEAIVGACETEGRTADGAYVDTLHLQRCIARRAPLPLGDEYLRACVREHRHDPWLMRLYAALLGVRMLAAEAAEREAGNG